MLSEVGGEKQDDPWGELAVQQSKPLSDLHLNTFAQTHMNTKKTQTHMHSHNQIYIAVATAMHTHGANHRGVKCFYDASVGSRLASSCVLATTAWCPPSPPAMVWIPHNEPLSTDQRLDRAVFMTRPSTKQHLRRYRGFIPSAKLTRHNAVSGDEGPCWYFPRRCGRVGQVSDAFCHEFACTRRCLRAMNHNGRCQCQCTMFASVGPHRYPSSSR